jgi:hypothetical protein
MARNRNGPQHQAKHFQPEDHAHAAHQEQVARGHENKPGQHAEENAKSRTGRAGYPVESAPKGPRKAQ